MLLAELTLALEYSEVGLGILIVLVLAGALWGPYFYKEIVRGKATVGPRYPVGPGDTHPGRRGDPAPGQPDAQSDPYDAINQR
jgi:hypothetical protein